MIDRILTLKFVITILYATCFMVTQNECQRKASGKFNWKQSSRHHSTTSLWWCGRSHNV